MFKFSPKLLITQDFSIQHNI